MRDTVSRVAESAVTSSSIEKCSRGSTVEMSRFNAKDVTEK